MYGLWSARPPSELENLVSKDVWVKRVTGHFHDDDFWLQLPQLISFLLSPESNKVKDSGSCIDVYKSALKFSTSCEYRMLEVPKDCLREARTLRASDRGKSTRRRHVPSLIEKKVNTSRCHGNKTKKKRNKWHVYVFIITGVFFALACATADLSKSTRPVTASLLLSHRNQIVHFESLLEIILTMLRLKW